MIVDPDFCDHWKTRMLIGLLADEAAPVYVLRLWAHCQHRRKAQFDNLTAEALKALCHFPGNSNKLDSSLLASGFIRRDDALLTVCNWDEYNSSLIAAWNNGRKGGRPKNSAKTAQNNPRKTTGYPTGTPTGLRVEKRREEKMREDQILNTLPPLADVVEKQPDPPAKKPRPRDPLFDAVAEVTASDPKASGSHIGRVCKALRNADPPYTAEEVKQWAADIVSQGWLEGSPSLGLLEARIGNVRFKGPTPTPSSTRRNGKANERTQYAYDPRLDPHAPEYVGQNPVSPCPEDAGTSGGSGGGPAG